MLNCKDASRLESQAQDRSLTFRERCGLQLHLWICSGCRNFTRQLQLIRLACQHIEVPEQGRMNAAALKPEAKMRILKEIAATQSKSGG